MMSQDVVVLNVGCAVQKPPGAVAHGRGRSPHLRAAEDRRTTTDNVDGSARVKARALPPVDDGPTTLGSGGSPS
jgi:hypothetical protein